MTIPIHCNASRGASLLGNGFSFIIALAFAFLSVALGIAPAHAQSPMLSPGDAIVTGFSGIKPPAGPLSPGASPLDGFLIDPNGASAQVQSLAAAGAPPSGQLITAPSTQRFKASEIGQVFAIALDDGLGAKTPNIYFGATSAYGLHIVRRKEGGFERLKQGAEGAEWMEGQFGPGDAGPGAIWKVDGETGAISRFTKLENSGPGLGDIVFDKAHKQFFVSDLDTGLIHRLSLTGDVIDSFDHGVAGRPNKGLVPQADDGRQADISSEAFAVENPESWGYTQAERMVWGLAFHEGRLYYAVTGTQQIWSIGIAEDGRFAGDARWEFDADRLTGSGPVTDMLFDAQGRLYLAQRGKPRGSYDYSLFAEPETSAVTRYRRERPDDPATESIWLAEAEDYSIGIPPEHRRTEGGIALGFAHDESGALRFGACGGTLWSTGHRLRSSNPGESETDPAEIDGTPGSEADVHGLQGNDVALVRPRNTPPTQSYFTDYDGFFGDAAKSGHLGDVEIWQPCEGVSAPQYGAIPPGYLLPLEGRPEDIPDDFIPEDEYRSNLRLVKHAWPRVCAPWGSGWLCRYQVNVRNTGPDPYFGLIRLRDWLPANPPGAIMAFSPSWTCWAVPGPSFRCSRPDVFLLPGASVTMTVLTWVPRVARLCELTNVAEIEHAPGGSARNTDPSDDADGATATIPDSHCRPGGRANLKLEKFARPHTCWRAGGDVACRYMMTVTNTGPGVYSGQIEVRDWVPAGVSASFSWGCAGVGGTFDCTHPAVNLPPTGARILWATFRMPVARAKELECRVRNRARITFAPGGAPMNTNPADDDATAVAIVPAEICDETPVRSNLRIRKELADDACVVTLGNWCRTFRITVTNTGPGPFNSAITLNEIFPAGASISTATAGWTCAGTSCSSTGAVPLGSGASTSLTVRMWGTGELARALNCRLDNKVAIASPLGAPRNTDPTDDSASASASLPEDFCRNRPVPSNLKITKAPGDGICLARNGTWCRIFKITVTNTGPGAYPGPISLAETLPAGATVSTGTPGWSCTGATCATAGPVTLPASPAAGSSAALTVVVRGSNDLARELGCRVTNRVAIADPVGAPRNTDAADDMAAASTTLSPDLCTDEIPRTNLRIEKESTNAFCLFYGVMHNWCKSFRITVTNDGPGRYDGPIVLNEMVPAGATLSGSGSGWSCAGATCSTDGPVSLASGASTSLDVQLRGTTALARELECRVTNRVAISSPVGGSRNTNAADDRAEASASLPAELCGRPLLPLPPTVQCPPGFSYVNSECLRLDPRCPNGWTRTPVKGKCCPPGEQWNGQSCGGDDTPPPTTDSCRSNLLLVNGKCQCGQGLRWNGKSCVPPTCPSGTSGNYPDCQSGDDDDDNGDGDDRTVDLCTGNRVMRNGTCVCLGALQWNGKRCVKKGPLCTDGRVLRLGRCACPGGLRWNGEECVRNRCPRGKVGTPPNCRSIVKLCPPGMRGRPPFCRSIIPFNQGFSGIPRRQREFDPNRFNPNQQRGGHQFGPRIPRLN